MENADTQILIEGLENYISLLRRDLQQSRDETSKYRKLWLKEAKSPSQLRDQFAMAALTGLLTHNAMTNGSGYAATLAYEIADAMLKVREIGNNEKT